MTLSVWRIKLGNLDQRNGQSFPFNFYSIIPFPKSSGTGMSVVHSTCLKNSESLFPVSVLFHITFPNHNTFQVTILFHNTLICHLETWMLPCLKRASSAARTTSNTWKTSFCFCLKLLTKSFIEVRFPPACLSHLICWLKFKNDLDRVSYLENVKKK